jgi:orotate phosphoribosyltransferase
MDEKQKAYLDYNREKLIKASLDREVISNDVANNILQYNSNLAHADETYYTMLKNVIMSTLTLNRLLPYINAFATTNLDEEKNSAAILANISHVPLIYISKEDNKTYTGKDKLIAKLKIKDNKYSKDWDIRNLSGKRIALIEDVLIDDAEISDAVEAIRTANGKVLECISIFDYNLKNSENNSKAPCEVFPVMTYDDVISTAVNTQRIDADNAKKLTESRDKLATLENKI